MSTARDAISIEALSRLAIFPLPNTVFFPHTILPLHIFEPRYREMTREAIETGMPIAVALSHPDGVLDAQGRPAYHPIAGVGLLVDHEVLPDGRYNILLHGLGRVRVVSELESTRSYRQVVAEWIQEVRPAADLLAERLATLRNSLMTLQRLHTEVGTPLMKMAYNIDDPDALVDIMASLLFPEVHRRQHLLGEARFDSRYDAVLGRITDLLIEGTEDDEIN